MDAISNYVKELLHVAKISAIKKSLLKTVTTLILQSACLSSPNIKVIDTVKSLHD